jgi:hypothetical protein
VCPAATRVYTNEDLDRVKPYRDQTGVNSTPAVAPASSEAAAPAAGSRARGRSRPHDETYWRHEADRHRTSVHGLEQRAAALRRRIADRRRQPKVMPARDPQIQAWQAQLDETDREIREQESRFEERARHEGALPGWLR